MSIEHAATEHAERIDRATDAIRAMSQDLAEDVAPAPTLLGKVCEATRQAPLQSLALAFLIGVIVARRR